MVKEVNEPSDKFKQHYFEFVTKDTLLERENKDHQCSGKDLVVLYLFYNHVYRLLTYSQILRCY